MSVSGLARGSAASADTDTTSFQLDAVAPNLAPSLALLADYVRRPALAPAELERVRAQQLAAISAEMKDPRSISSRVLIPLLYGTGHPYGIPPSGTGDPAVVGRLSRDELAAIPPHLVPAGPGQDTGRRRHHSGRSDAAARSEFRRLAAARPMRLRSRISPCPCPRRAARIILVDRPASPQSMIYAGRVLDLKGTDDLLTLQTANDILGGNFLSRINMNLRETKGWSYGVRSGVSEPLDRSLFTLRAPVQADRTGDSIAEIRQRAAKRSWSDKGVTAAELGWSTTGSARELPGSFETSADVLGGLARIVLYSRPDTYYETLAAPLQGDDRGRSGRRRPRREDRRRAGLRRRRRAAKVRTAA